jgi:hypothetical protein
VSIGEIRVAYREHYETAFEGSGVTLDDIDWTVPTEGWDERRRRIGTGHVDDQAVYQLSGAESEEFVIQ